MIDYLRAQSWFCRTISHDGDGSPGTQRLLYAGKYGNTPEGAAQQFVEEEILREQSEHGISDANLGQLHGIVYTVEVRREGTDTWHRFCVRCAVSLTYHPEEVSVP